MFEIGNRPCDKCHELVRQVNRWSSGHGGSGEYPPYEALVERHGDLVHWATRSAGPEGGSFLYQCRGCGCWWALHVWTCVGDLNISQGRAGPVKRGGPPDSASSPYRGGVGPSTLREVIAMALKDPIAVYNAANNVEAHLVCNLLIDAGIEAFVTEDVSAVGTWMGGLIPEIHKPQVWVERADALRAKPVLDGYERRAAELRNTDAAEEAWEFVEAVCQECGEVNDFPAALRGTVQECVHCGEYVDVGEEEPRGGWAGESGDEEVAEGP